uniref:CSON013001 protein n=1 Tax=Culicoides sonorensis TaxID=179676 RepID=A0A336LQU4_CULSO
MGLVKNVLYCAALIILIFLCMICLKRRRKNQGVIFTTVQAVPVANQSITVAPTNSAYVAHQSNYPTQPAPILATAYPLQTNAPPMQMPQPYQCVPPAQMPMPMPYGGAAVPTQFASPPPYDQVVKDPYQQQTPFNPHYTGN